MISKYNIDQCNDSISIKETSSCLKLIKHEAVGEFEIIMSGYIVLMILLISMFFLTKED